MPCAFSERICSNTLPFSESGRTVCDDIVDLSVLAVADHASEIPGVCPPVPEECPHRHKSRQLPRSFGDLVSIGCKHRGLWRAALTATSPLSGMDGSIGDCPLWDFLYFHSVYHIAFIDLMVCLVQNDAALPRRKRRRRTHQWVHQKRRVLHICLRGDLFFALVCRRSCLQSRAAGQRPLLIGSPATISFTSALRSPAGKNLCAHLRRNGSGDRRFSMIRVHKRRDLLGGFTIRDRTRNVLLHVALSRTLGNDSPPPMVAQAAGFLHIL